MDKTAHRVSHVLLAFGAASNVRWLRMVVLPTGVHDIEQFYKSRLRTVRQWSELSDTEQSRFPLRRAKFVGSVYDDATRECIQYYTCCTDERSRKAAPLDFDWLCAWCVERVDLCDLCILDE